MQKFDKKLFFEKYNPPLHPYIQVGGSAVKEFTLYKVLQALYPQESIEWMSEPNFTKIDTYVLFYSCPYDVKEKSLLKECIYRAQQLLANQLKSEAHILIILYRDLKVAFPERKLQREKFMSNMITQEILDREAVHNKKRIHVTHEFSTHDLQDSFQELIGSYIYFEVGSIVS